MAPPCSSTAAGPTDQDQRRYHDHLIIVCCHGIWLGPDLEDQVEGEEEVQLGAESQWLIAPYKHGETPTFIEHMKAGVQALEKSLDEQMDYMQGKDYYVGEANVGGPVLMFSGGPTRRETRLSEANSYLNLTIASSLFGIRPRHNYIASGQIQAEPLALDSHSNILFSIIQYWRTRGQVWPARLSIVSHAFKKTRLVDQHCGFGAVAFLPLSGIQFVGIDPPGLEDGSNEAAIKGKLEAEEQWRADPKGKGELLRGKRKARNPWGVRQVLFLSQEERLESQVLSEIVKYGDGMEEEFLIDSVQPWVRLDKSGRVCSA